MSLCTKPFLSPITIVWPGDTAIDLDKWTTAPGDYLTAICGGEQSPPIPPEKPGEKCTRFVFVPMAYDAYVHYTHLSRQSQYQDPIEDPEIQQHVIRHTLRELVHAYELDGDRQIPITVETDHGPYGERVTARCWSDHLIPFLDFAVRRALVSWCVQHSVERLLRTLA